MTTPTRARAVASGSLKALKALKRDMLGRIEQQIAVYRS
jgi:hypothetical protein